MLLTQRRSPTTPDPNCTPLFTSLLVTSSLLVTYCSSDYGGRRVTGKEIRDPSDGGKCTGMTQNFFRDHGKGMIEQSATKLRSKQRRLGFGAVRGLVGSTSVLGRAEGWATRCWEDRRAKNASKKVPASRAGSGQCKAERAGRSMPWGVGL